MMTSNKAATGYSRRVKRHLVCGAQSREQIHSRAVGLIRDFAEENPEALYADYVAAFGEPQDFAEDIMSVLNEREIVREKRKRFWMYASIALTGIAVLCLAVIYWYGQWKNAAKIVEEAPVFYVVENTVNSNYGKAP